MKLALAFFLLLLPLQAFAAQDCTPVQNIIDADNKGLAADHVTITVEFDFRGDKAGAFMTNLVHFMPEAANAPAFDEIMILRAGDFPAKKIVLLLKGCAMGSKMLPPAIIAKLLPEV